MPKGSIFKTVANIFIYYFTLAFFTSILEVIATSIGAGPLLKQILLLVATIISIVIITARLWSEIREQLGNFQKDFKKNIARLLGYWILGFGLMLIANYIINILIIGHLAPNEISNREVIDNSPLYAIPYVVLLAPIAEELLFRLNFRNLFKKKWPFVIVTGLIFGLMHVSFVDFELINLLYLIPYTILGIVFALIYYDTNSIAGSIGAHILHNAVTIAIILLGW